MSPLFAERAASVHPDRSRAITGLSHRCAALPLPSTPLGIYGRELCLFLLLCGALTSCAGRPAECAPENCGGCCNNNKCEQGVTTNACGTEGTACDTCVEGQECSSGKCRTKAPMMQGCVPETNEVFCRRVGCSGRGADNCGVARSVTCAVKPETDAELCTNGKCGVISAVDRCGASRSVNCTCTAPQTCGGAGVVGVCGCQETPAAFCARYNTECGMLTRADTCGVTRTVDCGVCGGANTCGGGGTPGLCGCTPRPNTAACTAAAATCGTLLTTNGCGQPLMVASCGNCAGTEVCGARAVNKCGCPAETDTAFCARLGASCGQVTGLDSCGQQHTASCGNCASPAVCRQAAPLTCCTPDSDTAICTANGRTCASLQTTDNCGLPRAIASCGTCAMGSSCSAGACCAPETDSAFCTRLGKNCGAASALDNCGVSRSVASCGTCTNAQTCNATAGSCCTPETDAAFCTRLGRVCGSATGADNCGVSRSVNSCGTCSPGVCTIAGACCTPNCAGKACGNNGCGGSCGSCGATQTCLPNNTCGTQACDVVTQAPCASADRCVLNVSSGVCTSVVGSGQQGSPCTSDSSCGRGLYCTSVLGTFNCREYCRLDSDCVSGTCAWDLGVSGLGVCSSGCSPTAFSTGCFSGQGCYAFNTPGKPQVTDCLSLGTAGYGSGCLNPNNCVNKSVCAASTCRQVCSLSSSSCPFGQTCSLINGWSTYGYCQ